MKWLDKIIDKKVQGLLLRIVNLEQENDGRQGEISELTRRLMNLAETSGNRLVKLDKETLELQESLSVSDRKMILRVDERDRVLREDMENGFKAVIKVFDDRLASLGEKKGIITDLLKKIARLEGVQGKDGES